MISGRNNYSSRKRSTSLWVAALILVAVLNGTTLAASQYFPQVQWRSASPESQGMSSEMLSELFHAIEKHEYGIDSVIIVRNGHVVLESYGYLQEPHFKHQIYSCTKSVASALIGIAIDKGYITSVDQTLLELFPENPPGFKIAKRQKSP